MLDQLILIGGPLAASAVLGAWVALGRLFLARWGGPRLPRWIATVVIALALTVGLVMLASGLITSATGVGVIATPAAERGAAAIAALLISPVWVAGAALAALGMVLHYSLDALLNRLRLDPVIAEGLARGLRAAWATLGLLTLAFGLQGAYERALTHYGMTLDTVIGGAGPSRFFLSLAAFGVALLVMLIPTLIESSRPAPHEPPSQA
jgi:hypothetical protein